MRDQASLRPQRPHLLEGQQPLEEALPVPEGLQEHWQFTGSADQASYSHHAGTSAASDLRSQGFDVLPQHPW